MKEINRLEIPAKCVASLCWQGEELVDWVSGGIRYGLDGSSTSPMMLYGYRFNRAIASTDGQFAVIYEALGTKGLVLKEGRIIREINRSYYCADVYEYPITLFNSQGEQRLLAHCPEEYNELEIEDVETGERLTKRSGEAADFFHSRLSVSPDGKYLMSAGWRWHPLDYMLVYDIGQVMSQPELLDAEPDWGLVAGRTEIHNAAFADKDCIIFASTDLYDDEAEEEEAQESKLGPDQIGRYSLTENRFLSVAPLKEPSGTLMPIGTFAVGFYVHPKLIEVVTGEVIDRWPDLNTGNQISSINYKLDDIPPFALDPANKRFAVADKEKITVVQLG